jgi:2-oxoglutarate ferredoxin oxidoreductase subunit alpha
MSAEQNRLTWLIGGAQGSGVDSAANVFARACAFGGLQVYGQREYYSNIMGEHSYYQLSVAETPVRAGRDYCDMLVSFDAETVFLHAANIRGEGALIYDPKLAETPLERVQAMENRARGSVAQQLAGQGLDPTVGSMVRIAEARGVQSYPIPYDDLLQKLSTETGTPLSALKRVANMLAVASSSALLSYPIELLQRALESIFAGKAKIIELNARACALVYQYVHDTFPDGFTRRLAPIDSKEERLYLTGNEAVALGKIAAGCSVQTYYPISPATDESTYLDAHAIFPLKADPGQSAEQKQAALLVLQTEDEIAAITSATGAALAGARAATSTSGPGFSLMVEGLGWAGINEVPVVVTLYQRGSPSTGLPTRSEQGDLRFALHAGHGEFPRLVLASGDLEESFYDAIRAFNWAERYQTPVIHLLDKALASSNQTLPPFDLKKIRIDRGQLLSEQALDGTSPDGYHRFAHSESGISPRTVLGVAGGIFWNTGDEHDDAGHITEDPVVREEMMEKRAQKLATAAREIPREEKYNFFGDADAETVIVSWGSPKGAILEALSLLAADGFEISFLQARLLSPLPADELSEALSRARRRIAVENNYSGQLAGLIREKTGIAMDHLIVKYNGRPISIDELYEALKGLLSKRRKALPQKVVLRHGV